MSDDTQLPCGTHLESRTRPRTGLPTQLYRNLIPYLHAQHRKVRTGHALRPDVRDTEVLAHTDKVALGGGVTRGGVGDLDGFEVSDVGPGDAAPGEWVGDSPAESVGLAGADGGDEGVGAARGLGESAGEYEVREVRKR